MPVVLRLSCRYFYKGALPTMKRFYFLLSFTTMFLLCANVAWAQQTAQNPAEKPSEKPKEEKKTPPAPEEKVVTSKHSLRIGGQEIKYTATAGTISLKLEDGTPKASIFYVAYTKVQARDFAERPITFSFNGGPGSSSLSRPRGPLC